MRQRSGAVLGARLLNVRGRTQRRHRRHRQLAALATAAGLVVTMAATTSTGATAALSSPRLAGADHGAFRQVNLVSDVPGMATLLDDNVKNPWGIAFGPKKTPTPLWVNNNFNPASNCGENCIPAPEDLLTKITLYSGANGVNPIAKVPLEVQASAPTGIVFNP